MGLLLFVARRLGFLVFVLLAISFLVYSAILLIPGDPVTAILGAEGYDPKIAEMLRHQLGIGEPLPVAYFAWLSRAVFGNLGNSVVLSTQTPVTTLIMQRLPVTLELAFFSMVIALALGIPFGVLAALRRNTKSDIGITVASLTAFSMPPFFRGILLILALSIYISAFPSGGYVWFTQDPLQNLRYIFLPSLSLALGLMGVITRFTRTSMLDVMNKEFMITAYAKGLPKSRVIYGHALRNALIPVVTVAGLQFGALMGGVVITETIFNVPGIGSLLVQAILERDYPVVQGTVLVIATSFVLVNTLVDIVYGIIDPRTRAWR